MHDGRLSTPFGSLLPFQSGSAESITDAPVVVNPDAASKIASCGYMWVTRKNGSAEKISAASQPNVTVANPSRTPVFADLSLLCPLRSAPPTPAAIVRIEQNENCRSTVSGSFIRKPTGRHTSIAVPMKAVRTETR